jgi:hypothetical protein
VLSSRNIDEPPKHLQLTSDVLDRMTLAEALAGARQDAPARLAVRFASKDGRWPGACR